MSYDFGERQDTFNAARKDSAGEFIQKTDASMVRTCDYCGFVYEIERLTIDYYGFWACPTDLYEPEPQPIYVEEYDDPSVRATQSSR